MRWASEAGGKALRRSRLQAGPRGLMADHSHVAIIGAGMGGLATAAALRKVGIDVTVYEQAKQFVRLGGRHPGRLQRE
jgi:NADPH-dependent 2,4-dienoyl-CoA reductase/sulfur reductase-like enzyme